MDWEALGAGGASLIQKAQKLTESLTGKNSGESSSGLQSSKNSASAIPFASKDHCTNDEVWILGRKYFSQSGTPDDYLPTLNNFYMCLTLRNLCKNISGFELSKHFVSFQVNKSRGFNPF